MSDVARSGAQAVREVDRAARSGPARAVVRIGIGAYGLTHVLIAWLALQVAVSGSRQKTDQSGAFETLAQGAAGRVLLWVLVVGFAAVAVWRLGEALRGFGYETDHARALRSRVESAGKAVVFVALAVLAARTAASGSGGAGGQAAAAGVMGLPGGQWVVGVVGVGIVVVGAVTAWRGGKKSFVRDMDLPADRRARTVAVRTGQIGTVAKGVAVVLIGVLVVVAAVTFRPEEANGLDAALKTLAAQPFGAVLLVVMAAGLAAFGVFCFFDARYHRV